MPTRKIVVILDNIRSRENVGSIFRTADATGVVKMYLCGITPTPRVGNSKFEILNPKPRTIAYGELRGRQIQNTDKIAKTALGAEKWVPWEYQKQTWRLIEKLKKEGYQVLALEKTKTAKDIFKFKTKNGPVALVVGNEVSGLSPDMLARSDTIISIPMHGQKESLNVAVAFGIAVYTLIKS